MVGVRIIDRVQRFLDGVAAFLELVVELFDAHEKSGDGRADVVTEGHIGALGLLLVFGCALEFTHVPGEHPHVVGESRVERVDFLGGGVAREFLQLFAHLIGEREHLGGVHVRDAAHSVELRQRQCSLEDGVTGQPEQGDLAELEVPLEVTPLSHVLLLQVHQDLLQDGAGFVGLGEERQDQRTGVDGFHCVVPPPLAAVWQAKEPSSPACFGWWK